MYRKFMLAASAAAILAAGHAAAQVTLYSGEGYRGRAVTIDKEARNLERIGFNDRAASAVVERGRWEVCEHARFEGTCVVLRRGSYDSLRSLGMSNSISSV